MCENEINNSDVNNEVRRILNAEMLATTQFRAFPPSV
jgi:hypothetical protein